MSPARPFRLLTIGLLVVAFDFRASGYGMAFDVLPDVAGYALVFVGGRTLARSDNAFGLTSWSAALMAVFSLRSQLWPNPSLFSSGSDGFEQLEVDLPYLIIALTGTATALVLVMSMVEGIGRMADRQEAPELRSRANTVQLHVIMTFLFGLIIYSAALESGFFDDGVRPYALVAVVWLGFRLLRLLGAAGTSLSISSDHDQPVAPLPGSSVPAFMIAAAVAVFSLTYVPPPAAAPGGPEMAQALTVHPDGLADNPDLLRFNTYQSGPVRGDTQLCEAIPARLIALDPDTGDERWNHIAPSDPGFRFPLANETLLVVVDDTLGRFLPSVAVFDVVSGEVLWRRFFSTESIRAYPLVGDQILIEQSGNNGEEFAFVLDHDGSIVAEYMGADNVDITTQLGFDGLLNSSPGPGEGDLYDMDLFDEIYTWFGNPTSLGPGVQTGDDEVMALLSSERGPNSRLIVFDRMTMEEIWRLEPVRSAAVAGDKILYDSRNDQPADALSTRNLFLVDGGDPSIVEWSTKLQVGDAGAVEYEYADDPRRGNGYLGTVSDGLVFAVVDDEIGLDFLVIDDPADVPPLISAASGFGGGDFSDQHVDDDVFAAGTKDGLVIKPRSRPTRLIPFDRAIETVDRMGHLLLLGQSETQVCRP